MRGKSCTAIPTSCHACGACCLKMESPPFVPNHPDDLHVAKLPDEVRKNYKRGMEARARAGWPEGTPCFWFDLETRKCRHYEYRPLVCRQFQRGCAACLSYRHEHRELLI